MAPGQDAGRGPDGRLTLGARLAMVVVCLAVFLSALDQYVLVTMLNPTTPGPGLMRDLGVSVNELDRAAWIVNGYLLGYIVAMPLMGRLSDIYGRRLIFAVCLVLFALGSLCCGLAPALGSSIAPDTTTLGGAVLTPLYLLMQKALLALGHLGIDTSLPALSILVGARFIQAIGGGALVPVALAVVGDLFGVSRRGLALGVVGAVAELGGLLGPLWGAEINNRLGWQWIFYLNIPVALGLLAAGAFALPRFAAARGRVDLLGTSLLGGFLVCLAAGFGLQSQFTVSSSVVAPKPALLLAAAILLGLFILIELRRRSPAIDVRQFGKRAFSAAALLSFFTGVSLVVAIVLIPAFMTTLQPTAGGLAGAFALLRMTIFIPLGALAGGWLSTRFGCSPGATTGTLLSALGLFLMSQWPASVGVGQMTVATTLAGLGFGLVIAPTSTSALNAAGTGREGMAGAVITVLRMAGMLLGLSWALLYAVSRFTALVAPTPSLSPADVMVTLHTIFGELFMATAAIALVSVAPALFLWRKPRGGSARSQAQQEYASYVAPLT
ncbi:MAG TPA: MFS transporter [Ktedonobacterales bacterium]